MEAEAIEMNEI